MSDFLKFFLGFKVWMRDFLLDLIYREKIVHVWLKRISQVIPQIPLSLGFHGPNSHTEKQ